MVEFPIYFVTPTFIPRQRGGDLAFLLQLFAMVATQY
jgi:hypothetical protein